MLKLRTIALTTIMTTTISQAAFARGHGQSSSNNKKVANNEMEKTSAPTQSSFTTSVLAGYDSTTVSSNNDEGTATKFNMTGPIVGIEALGGFKMGQNGKFNLGIAIVHKSLSGQYKPEGYADLVAKYNVNLTTANIILSTPCGPLAQKDIWARCWLMRSSSVAI